MLRGISFLFVAGGAGVLLSSYLLPPWIAGQIESGIRSAVQSAERVEVKVGPVPTWELLTGRLRGVHIDIRGLVTKEGFPVDSLLFDTERIGVKMGTLLGEGRLEVKNLGPTRVTVVLTAADLTRYLQQQVSAVSEPEVVFADGMVRVRGKAKILGQPLDVSVGGKLEISGPTSIRFRPVQVTVEKLSIPRFLLDPIADRLDFTVDLGKLPLPLVLESLRLEAGRVFVYGRNP